MIEWIPGAINQWFLVKYRKLVLQDYTGEWEQFKWEYRYN